MRSRANSLARGSHTIAPFSGVTITTNPSGTTIYKNTVQTTNLNNETSTGYALPYAMASGKKMTAGILSCAGTSLSRQTLGLTTINFCQVVPAMNRAAASPCVVQVVKPKSAAWASGVTHVDLYVFSSPQGAAFGSAVSLMYFAVGA